MTDTEELTLYVATNGRDSWSGQLAHPDQAKTDGPFATVTGARNAIRELKKGAGLKNPVRVIVCGGTYYLKEPIIFTSEDSGTPECPITYSASPGEKVVISGGETMSGWEPAGGSLWSIDLPEVKDGNRYFRQLFISGERRKRPRLPREGAFRVANSSHNTVDSWAASLGDNSGSKLDKEAFEFKPGDIKKTWVNIEDVEIIVLQYWAAPHLRISSVDETAHVVKFTGGSWRPLTWSFGYYIDNVYEGLDTPGSWYLDRKKGILYYHPLPGEDMNKVVAIVPVLEQLVQFEGNTSRHNFVTDIILQRFNFHHTNWTLSEAGYTCHQAELPAPNAISARGMLRCRIEECELAHLGGWGIDLGPGCQDNTVAGNTICDVGAGCVKIGEVKNCKKDVEEACCNVISDNRFLAGSEVYLGAPAVWIGQSGDNTIAHNEISGAFMWAISVGWNWDYFPLNRARDNIIEFNYIHHIGTGVLGTLAAIYALGTSPGTVIRNNYIHHVFSNEHWGAGEGISLDNGCTGILIENNLVHDAVAGGWGCNFNCFGNLIINNIFAYGTKFQLTRYGDPPQGTPPPNGEVFACNIVVWKEGPLIRDKDWGPFQTLWNRNLYFHTGGEPVKFMKYSFEEWKRKGIDTDSIIADPLFVDPEKDDYSLKPESPAFALGFKPIDLSNIGPRKKREF